MDLFILISCLLDITLILLGEVLSWSLMEVPIMPNTHLLTF